MSKRPSYVQKARQKAVKEGIDLNKVKGRRRLTAKQIAMQKLKKKE
ncbi:MAG: hypothetical protein HON47_01985 [Candidatus Diapherotrites archaeon]|jgi:hypothetical protein|uniref:Uncharacterized protein n=1 Tax=Candidatus Iainarchaeum sp. TaxID=3101447 RepID=A0A8T5GFL0_9ARCH|nr:hypothetical protein [Candidatus Diapherotrites archaeon]MBT7241496.1 hypothetical protein [Candidatus Diapherotrites archaeon]